MTDIFVSCARADRVAASQLAGELSERDWSVWWGRKIPPGRPSDEVIEQALDAARSDVELATLLDTIRDVVGGNGERETGASASSSRWIGSLAAVGTGRLYCSPSRWRTGWVAQWSQLR